MDKILPVTCAIIECEGKVLCAQRSESMPLPLKWEFPGGKIEKGESAEQCLIREIKEELNLKISILKAFKSHIHTYDSNKKIELIPFLCSYIGDEIKLKEHKQIRWVKVEKLLGLDWAEADIPIVRDYIERCQTRRPDQ